MCEYCKKDHTYKHDCQDNVENYKLKEHEQQSSQCNFTTIIGDLKAMALPSG